MGEDVVSKYSGQLADLKINSKPLINLLTMMAEDYIRQAPAVVQCIEKHLNSVRPEIKLPALYLIDSIIKNVRKDYIQLFTQNIVSTFGGVFEKADEKTRTLLWKLRSTWTDHFPHKKLYAIDLRCREVDPKWPMTIAPASINIHVNPRFLNRNKSAATALMSTEQILAQSSSMSVASPTTPLTDVDMQAQLIAKQKELIELQARKVELELMQTKLQMQERARKEKEEEATRQIDVAVRQERILLGMAETAKSRTEKLQQKLLTLHQKPGSTSTSPASTSSTKISSPSKYDSSSDRESHSSSTSLRAIKSHSETSVASVDGSLSKNSKSSRDRKDRSKTDKNKDRVDFKEKESRHSKHRDKDRRGESRSNSKDKDKDKSQSRSHDKSRESSSVTVSKSGGGGEWKDYNAVKKMSPPKRSHKKDSDDDIQDIKIDTKAFNLSPTLSRAPNSPGNSSKAHDNDHDHTSANLKSPSKSPSSSSTSPRGESSDRSSPLKRRLHKNSKSSHEKERTKEKSAEKSDIKPIVSDPRLRKRQEEATEEDEKCREVSRETSSKKSKENEWRNYNERQKAVLRRSYRKNPDIEAKEASPTAGTIIKAEASPGGTSDMDLRFEGHMDVDLRTESDGTTEPPSKKSRPGKEHGTFDDLFGHQDVDLRAGSSCWTQVKSEERDSVEDRKNTEDNQPNQPSVDGSTLARPQVPPSPADSVCSGSSISTCDPLGRPLIYNRLPNDPEERKRSLDSRSNSIDPVVRFISENVDHIVQTTGELSQSNMRMVCVKAKDELDESYLNADQYIEVMKQVLKIHEATALRDVQMKGDSWQTPNMANNTPGPNPWVQDMGERNIWTAAAFGPAPPVVPIAGTFNRRFPGPGTPWENSGATPWMAAGMPSGPTGPNPFEEASAMPIVDDLVPKASKKDLHMADQDVGHNIPIDKIQRQVRFYRDTTVVFMGIHSDDPRELNFQRDDTPRQVLINGKPLELFLGETKKFDFNRVPHTVKLGTPGRELCVDDRRFEVFFGGQPTKVPLDGRFFEFQLLPPSPQVSVGQQSRYDLCAGRVNLIIDAVNTIPMYLDERLQKIDIFGEPIVARFATGFQTVFLNGRPFPTNFGARMPFSVTVPGTGKHYLRFSSISPETERAIQIYLNSGSEWGGNRNNFGGRGAKGAMMMMRGGRGRGGVRGRGGRDMPIDNRMQGSNPWVSDVPAKPSSSQVNPLDVLNNMFRTPSESNTRNNVLEQSYESEPTARAESSEARDEKRTESDGTSENNLNVSDLVANLIKYGLLPTSAPSATESNSPGEPVQEESTDDDKKNKETDPKQDVVPEKEKEKPKEVKPTKPTIPPLPTIDLTFNDNLKERRKIAIDQILTGVQCSQCGLRFAPDQTLRYSQHLDWHFRQNRRDKANARKALSRQWYYDLSDWIQFEEIEDLEERAASVFESKDDEKEKDAKSPTATLNPEDVTVLASSHEGAVCPQCSEEFESYFDEEREEWRLKNAKVDDFEETHKLYHPNCLQDYLRSLVEVDDTVVEETNTAEPDPVSEATEESEEIEASPKPAEMEEDDEVLILQEGKKEVVVMEIDIDDDDVDKNDNHSVIVNIEDHENSENKTDDNNSVANEENINVQIESVCIENNSPNLLDVNNDARNSFDQSPILIDEDSTFLPGLNSDSNGGVFGFALGTIGSQQDRFTEQEDDDKKIIYEPMKFDIPVTIKLEPPEEDEPMTEETQHDGFMQNLQPFIAASSESVPMNIDLTEEDSSDAVDSGARLVTQIRTSIDGNLQHEDTTVLPFIPAAKIRINISGLDMAPLGSPKEKVDSPQPIPPVGGDSENTENQGLVDDGHGGSSNSNVVSTNLEINKDNNPDELVLTEEMKRLKPRLVGRKLTNCPPKFKGKEESGLCVIC